MIPTYRNFFIVTVFMRNEQATTYEQVLHQLKKLYFDVSQQVVVITNKETHLIPVISLEFNKSYHILCKRYIEQKIEENLISGIGKDGAEKFVQTTWRRIISFDNEVDYTQRLEMLNTNWSSMQWFLGYLYDEQLNTYAHKFVRVWAQKFLFRVEDHEQN